MIQLGRLARMSMQAYLWRRYDAWRSGQRAGQPTSQRAWARHLNSRTEANGVKIYQQKLGSWMTDTNVPDEPTTLVVVAACGDTWKEVRGEIEGEDSAETTRWIGEIRESVTSTYRGASVRRPPDPAVRSPEPQVDHTDRPAVTVVTSVGAPLDEKALTEALRVAAQTAREAGVEAGVIAGRTVYRYVTGSTEKEDPV
jgi:hypothetical protein